MRGWVLRNGGTETEGGEALAVAAVEIVGASPRDRYRYFASTEHPDPALCPVLRVSYVAETSPPTATITAP